MRVAGILLVAGLLGAGLSTAQDGGLSSHCSTALYAADGAGAIPGSLYLIDPATGGIGSTIGAIGAPLTGLAAHPTTCDLWGTTSLRFDAVDNPNPGHLVTIDKMTGAATVVGDILPGTDFGPADITFAPDGTLFGWSTDSDDLITIDLATGAGTVVGDSGLEFTVGNGLVFSPDNNDGNHVIYLSPDGSSVGGTLATIDPATGLVAAGLELSGDLVDGSALNALDFSCTGALFGSQPAGTGGAGPTILVTIHPTSGAIATLGNLPAGIDALAWTCMPSAGTDFFTVNPCRVLDTREPDGPLGGPALAAGEDRVFPFATQCGIPSTATAVSLNVAVTGSTGPGNLRLHPGRSAVPLVSSINYAAGQTRSNNAVVPLNELGELSAFAGQASGIVHLILDVNGYFQ